MDKGWVVIAFFMIVVGIPVILGVFGDMQKRKMKLKERELELLGTRTAEEVRQQEVRTAELEQRVRVLEKIITDGGYETAVQIEALREPRLTQGEKVQ